MCVPYHPTWHSQKSSRYVGYCVLWVLILINRGLVKLSMDGSVMLNKILFSVSAAKCPQKSYSIKIDPDR